MDARLALSRKQRMTLETIRAHMEKHGYSPTYREIANALGLASPATVHEHVRALGQKGYLKISKEGGRAFVLLNEQDAKDRHIDAKGYILDALSEAPAAAAPQTSSQLQAIEIPLVGLVTAGEPIEAVEQRETIVVPANFVRDQANTFVLRVRGESMRDEGILDGDLVIVERNPSPKDGDVVVALLDNAYATLKRFFREKDRIRLQPANPAMSPIYSFNPTIQGVVRGVIRNFASA